MNAIVCYHHVAVVYPLVCVCVCVDDDDDDGSFSSRLFSSSSFSTCLNSKSKIPRKYEYFSLNSVSLSVYTGLHSEHVRETREKRMDEEEGAEGKKVVRQNGFVSLAFLPNVTKRFKKSRL